MARPKMNTESVRSVIASVRVTGAEEEALAALGGTRTKGLRRLIDAHMAARSVVPSTTGHRSAPASTGSVTHRHRRGDLLRTDMERGAEVKVYACTGCGEELR